MNARDAIKYRAEKNGWSRIVGDVDGEIWARGGDRVVVKYKLYGNYNNYMCRFYGIENPYHGVNYGVETAVHGDKLITGKNKKGQVLKALSL